MHKKLLATLSVKMWKVRKGDFGIVAIVKKFQNTTEADVYSGVIEDIFSGRGWSIAAIRVFEYGLIYRESQKLTASNVFKIEKIVPDFRTTVLCPSSGQRVTDVKKHASADDWERAKWSLVSF